MNATTDTILNHAGGKLLTRTGAKRLHRTSICFMGVDLDVEYDTQGCFMSATETDAADYPMCIVKVIEVAGVDVTRLLSAHESDIAERIEATWRGEL